LEKNIRNDTILRTTVPQIMIAVLFSALMIFGITSAGSIDLALHLRADAQEDSYCDPSNTSCSPTDILVDADGNVICDPHTEDCSQYLTMPETPETPAPTEETPVTPDAGVDAPSSDVETPPADAGTPPTPIVKEVPGGYEVTNLSPSVCKSGAAEFAVNYACEIVCSGLGVACMASICGGSAGVACLPGVIVCTGVAVSCEMACGAAIDKVCAAVENAPNS
jgi:hypothetical protein